MKDYQGALEDAEKVSLTFLLSFSSIPRPLFFLLPIRPYESLILPHRSILLTDTVY